MALRGGWRPLHGAQRRDPDVTHRSGLARHLDIFNTGDCVSATGLARSRNLESWESALSSLPSSPVGITYCRRINSIVRHNGQYVGFYGWECESPQVQKRLAWRYRAICDRGQP